MRFCTTFSFIEVVFIDGQCPALFQGSRQELDSLLTGCPAVPSNLARTISYCDLYKFKKCMCTSSGWDLHSLHSHSPVGMSSSSRGGSLYQKKLQYYTHQNIITSQCGKFQVVLRTDSKVCVVVCHCKLKTYDTKNFNCVIQKNVNNYS